MKQAAIIGGGVIGGGCAARFLLNGWDVAVFDPDPDAERKIGEVLANARRSLPMLYEMALPSEGQLRFAGSVAEAVEGADYIQESVNVHFQVKAGVREGGYHRGEKRARLRPEQCFRLAHAGGSSTNVVRQKLCGEKGAFHPSAKPVRGRPRSTETITGRPCMLFFVDHR